MQKNRVYISEDTFSAFVSFIQKGLEQNMYFFVYDCQNLIQERLWTFSSTAFVPNVKEGDILIKKHKVPVIITTDVASIVPDEYLPIAFEPLTPPINLCTVFMKSKEDAQSMILKKEKYESFMKADGKWQKIIL
ncbi:MAG: hypothetical protein O3A66_01095 [Proteobacteria bacterium]|nr:hypothetical protein [Pseudomonadota bacterium]